MFLVIDNLFFGAILRAIKGNVPLMKLENRGLLLCRDSIILNMKG